MGKYQILLGALKIGAFLVLSSTISAQTVDLAITVDDLPVHGPLPQEMSHKELVSRFLKAFEKHNLPGIYGFVNASQLQSRPQYEEVLNQWVSAGHLLGNHTFTHPDLDHEN